MRKSYSLFILFLLAATGIQAQEFSNNQIRISTRKLDCAPGGSGTQNHYLALVVENKTKERLSVSFEKQAHYGDVCIGCKGGAESLITLELKPGEIKSGSCENPGGNLRVFESSEGGSRKRLSRLNFGQVKIETIR